MDNIETIIEDKEVKQPFYSYRRVVKCYSLGISFLTDNILFLLKVFSPLFAIFALVSTLSFMTFFQMVNLPVWFSVVYALIQVCALVCVIAMVSRLFEQEALSKGFLGYNFITLIKASRKQLMRTVCVFCVHIAVCVLFALPVVLSSLLMLKGKNMEQLTMAFLVVGAISMAMFAIALFAYAIPCVVAVPYSIMERGNVFKNMWKGFKSGYKVWGKCFGLSFLVAITVVIIAMMLFIPNSVLFGIQSSIMMSRSMGDPIYVPSFLTWLMPLVQFLTYFVSLLLVVVSYSSYVYLYASVKADEIQQASVSKIDEI